MTEKNKAKTLRSGNHVFHVEKKDSRGKPVTYKVTSVKTWKRNTNRIEIGLKYGLYQYEKINESHLHLITKDR